METKKNKSLLILLNFFLILGFGEIAKAMSIEELRKKTSDPHYLTPFQKRDKKFNENTKNRWEKINVESEELLRLSREENRKNRGIFQAKMDKRYRKINEEREIFHHNFFKEWKDFQIKFQHSWKSMDQEGQKWTESKLKEMKMETKEFYKELDDFDKDFKNQATQMTSVFKQLGL